MLFKLSQALVAATLLFTAATAAPAPAVGAPVEREIPRSPSSVAKLEAMKRWQAQVARRASEQASKYPVDHIGNVSDYSLFDEYQDTGKMPEPIRGKTGSQIFGPTDSEIDRQNPDLFAPPNSDSGSVPNAKWPFALSHNRLQNGGWARQQNVDVLPVATELAGVQMHLDRGALRELHWHTAGEWAYVLNGTLRVAISDANGSNYINQVSQGDLWFFPSGMAHSIQAVSDGGAEFLLVFDDGSFSEDETFLLSDFLSHIPREVLSKNFPEGFNNSDFDNLPDSELYIFPAPAGVVPYAEDANVDNPQGQTQQAYTYNASAHPATQLPGGSVKIVDSRNFSVTDISLAEITINPGAIRELHWHPNSDEWSYFLSGHARITVWAGTNNARTFDYQAGDVAYIPKSQGHYIEALGKEPVKYLELFKAPIYQDISLSQWLAVMPPSVVQDHLGFSNSTMQKLRQYRTHDHPVVGGNGNQKLKRGLPSGPYGDRQLWA